MDDFIRCLGRDYFNFAGLEKRRAFWLAKIIIIIVNAAFLTAFITNIQINDGQLDIIGGGVVVQLGLLWAIYSFIPNLSMTVRRLRDAGFSVWWVLLALIGFDIIYLVMCCFKSRRPNNPIS